LCPALGGERPARRNLLAPLAREIDLAARHTGVRHVHHEGRVPARGRGDRPRIGADDFSLAAPRRDRGAAIGHEHRHAPLLRAHARVVHAGAEVIGVPHRDRGDAVRLRTPDRLLRRVFRGGLPDAVGGIDHRDGARIDDKARVRRRLHRPALQAREIPAGAQHAVGLVAPEIRLHERVGEQRRVGSGDASAFVDAGDEIEERLVADAHRGYSGLKPMSRTTFNQRA